MQPIFWTDYQILQAFVFAIGLGVLNGAILGLIRAIFIKGRGS